LKIAVLGAMPEEIEPLLKKLDYRVEEFANNKFYFAKFNNHELIIAYSKIGKVNSTLTATLMIEKFGAEALIFTGVAGALKEGLKIGDIVLATSLVQHDIDITAFGHPYGFVPESPIFVKTDANLNKVAKETAKKLNLELFEGIVASGDQFISSKEKKEWIKSTFKADLAEMEGASVGMACYALNTPFIVLRTVSDSADDSADIDFDKFMTQSAKINAEFTLKMIENL